MQTNAKTNLIFDHDGGVDDLLSLMLILSMPNINLLGVTITPADCYADDAVTSTLKILALYGKKDIPVSVGNQYGPNAFPGDFRAQPRACHAMPAMVRIKENRAQLLDIPAHEWIISTLKSTNAPVALLLTGPASNLTKALSDEIDIKSSISKVIWMGGAVGVRGNVATLILLPLDASNALPVSWPFLEKLAETNTPITDLAGQFWATTVTAIPSYEYTYFMWDILATSLLSLPEEHFGLTVGHLQSSTVTPNAGQIWQVKEGQGHPASWVDSVNADAVIDYIITTLANGNVNMS